MKSFGISLAALVMVAATIAGLAFTSVAHAQTAAVPAVGTSDKDLYEAAKKEGSLTWYVSAPIEAMRGAADEFEKQYPGVTVNVLRIVGVAQYQRYAMETQAKQYIADVLSNSDYPSMSDLIDQGTIADWKIPTFDRIPADMKIKTGAFAPSTNSVITVYNVNKVTPEEVKILGGDWKGIADPRFKGRMATSDQKTGSAYAGIHLFLDPKLADRYGEKFIHQVALNKITEYGDIVVVPNRVGAGENDIGILVGEQGGSAVAWAAGAPIRWVSPSPSPVWGTYWQGIAKNAPHPNAARLFQNWTSEEDGMKALQLRTSSATTLKGLPDERKVAQESWYPKVTDPYTPDWARWGANFDKDFDLWNKIIKAGQ